MLRVAFIWAPRASKDAPQFKSPNYAGFFSLGLGVLGFNLRAVDVRKEADVDTGGQDKARASPAMR